jgi:iron complex outermembrane recepter protein
MGPLANTYRQLGQGFTPVSTSSSQTPIAFFSGSNPDLEPESSVSRTLGLVWSPGFLQGLNASLDWWNIRIENTIVGDSATQQLNDCYILGIASRCATSSRDATLGYVNNLLIAGINAGFRETEGYDFDLSYRLATDKLGTFALSWQTTYTARDEIKVDTSSSTLPQQLVGYATSPGFLGTHRIRSNMNVLWTQGDWSMTWGARHYSSQKETCLSAALFPEECSDPAFRAANPQQTRPINKSGSITFNDVELRYSAPWNATIAVGANNVFERVGPQFYTQPGANVVYHGQYDIGRFVYMKYQQRF